MKAATVELADQQSAAGLLYSILNETVRRYEPTFSPLQWPNEAAEFRKHYPLLLPQLESLRLASAQRLEIADTLVTATGKSIGCLQGDQFTPLDQMLATNAEPFSLHHHQFSNNAGWLPTLAYHGERHTGAELAELAERMQDDLLITAKAAQGIAWLLKQIGPEIDLRSRKIVVLGAGAEMAPTRQWLNAGARVLWLDTRPPPDDWFANENLSGQLSWPAEPADLLTEPQRIKATIEAFAEDDPIDLGLYAYAPGQARELKLTATMNAIVSALPASLIRTITMLISPTTPTALSPQDLQHRIESRPWQRLCANIGLLSKSGGYAGTTGHAATTTVVGIQGASYQAAQYLAKILPAELWHHQGYRVSANTAAITRTRSLAHPVFTAAFGGAKAFGVQTLTPRQSRTLNGLLSACDWLQPERPIPGEVRVHGGIHSLSYPLDSALTIAAAIGFARSPSLLAGLIRR